MTWGKLKKIKIWLDKIPGIALELELDNELVGAANSLRACAPATERDQREPPGAMIQHPII